jgi:hypothetical protein
MDMAECQRHLQRQRRQSQYCATASMAVGPSHVAMLKLQCGKLTGSARHYSKSPKNFRVLGGGIFNRAFPRLRCHAQWTPHALDCDPRPGDGP